MLTQRVRSFSSLINDILKGGMQMIEYNDYLKLDIILNSQDLESEKQTGTVAHEEMLFIITHQSYELWFKQIKWEIDSIILMFSERTLSDENLSRCVHRLRRINEIWKLLISKISVLETMSPLEFLKFRSLLFPASGFQSHQFRLLENRLGLNSKKRIPLGNDGKLYHEYLAKKKQNEIVKSEKEESLFSVVEKWLERTPYIKLEDFDFWENYSKAVNKMFEDERTIIRSSEISSEEKIKSMAQISSIEESFNKLIDEEKFLEDDDWRLSHKALKAALFIQLYRHNPKISLAFSVIEQLIDMDEHMTNWRSRHAQMALRMLGKKMGSGGSSGEQYLKEAALHHKVFGDFFRLTTFFIEEEKLVHI